MYPPLCLTAPYTAANDSPGGSSSESKNGPNIPGALPLSLNVLESWTANIMYRPCLPVRPRVLRTSPGPPLSHQNASASRFLRCTGASDINSLYIEGSGSRTQKSCREGWIIRRLPGIAVRVPWDGCVFQRGKRRDSLVPGSFPLEVQLEGKEPHHVLQCNDPPKMAVFGDEETGILHDGIEQEPVFCRCHLFYGGTRRIEASDGRTIGA